MTRSIFERVGGFKTVRKIVSDFYDRVLDDEVLVPYFANVDMQGLIDHQTKFFATVLGGPASYTDEQLGKVHEGMSITNQAFEIVCELVSETLEDHDLPDDDVQNVLAKLAGLKPHLVKSQ
jgi:hemoglobin